MKRREPPPLAAWMLEHLTSGDRDEALSGDLLEVFRSGRSGSWYWRQVCGACAVSWFNSIRTRIPMFVFALAWSMLAPAWTRIVDRIQATRLFSQLWRMMWPFSTLAQFAAWIDLAFLFLWTGILLYFLLQLKQTRALGSTIIRGAFFRAPLFLLPAYFVTFVLANLFAYPGLAIDRHTLSPLQEITDLHLWADVLRIPYLLALVGALWNAVPHWQRGSQPATSLPADDEDSASPPAMAGIDTFTLTKFFSLMVAAGLLNAMIIGVIFCRLPDTHAPNLASLLATATAYVLIGALAGVSGSWLYWKSPSSPFRQYSPLPFPLFALVCAAGWVWVTPMLLLAEQVSPATAFAAMIGAFILTTGLRNASYPSFAAARPLSPRWEPVRATLFSEAYPHPPFQPYGYLIALGIYASGAALYTHSNYTASLCLGFSAAVFAWKRTLPGIRACSDPQQYRRAALKLALIAIPAIIVTAWAMLDGIAQRNQIEAEEAAAAALQARDSKTAPKPDPNASALGSSGYESLILWPFPPKKELIAPVPPAHSLLAPGTTKPLILRFDGTYEYVQPPDQRPGPTAHHAHGTPLRIDIASNNDFPVMMHAHQNLPAPIPVAGCSEIQIEIENADNREGIVSLGLLLEDGLPGHEQTAYLGQQSVISTEPGRFYIKSAPVIETLRFAVPREVKLRKFTELTILVLPDVEHQFAAPRIAIREFRFFPR